jgi:hypothetical protein
MVTCSKRFEVKLFHWASRLKCRPISIRCLLLCLVTCQHQLCCGKRYGHGLTGVPCDLSVSAVLWQGKWSWTDWCALWPVSISSAVAREMVMDWQMCLVTSQCRLAEVLVCVQKLFTVDSIDKWQLHTGCTVLTVSYFSTVLLCLCSCVLL